MSHCDKESYYMCYYMCKRQERGRHKIIKISLICDFLWKMEEVLFMSQVLLELGEFKKLKEKHKRVIRELVNNERHTFLLS
jgi:hypothetical protein